MWYYSQTNNIKVQWKTDRNNIETSIGSRFYNKTDNKELKKFGLPDLER